MNNEELATLIKENKKNYYLRIEEIINELDFEQLLSMCEDKNVLNFQELVSKEFDILIDQIECEEIDDIETFFVNLKDEIESIYK